MFKRASNATARLYGKVTGKFLTETDYNKLSRETRELINTFDINKLIGNSNDIEKVKILVSTQNIINNALNKVYQPRLNYLIDKQNTDPNNKETPNKISAIKDIIDKLNNILVKINEKLREIDSTGEIQADFIKKAKNATSSSGYSSSDLIDLIVF